MKLFSILLFFNFYIFSSEINDEKISLNFAATSFSPLKKESISYKKFNNFFKKKTNLNTLSPLNYKLILDATLKQYNFQTLKKSQTNIENSLSYLFFIQKTQNFTDSIRREIPLTFFEKTGINIFQEVIKPEIQENVNEFFSNYKDLKKIKIFENFAKNNLSSTLSILCSIVIITSLLINDLIKEKKLTPVFYFSSFGALILNLIVFHQLKIFYGLEFLKIQFNSSNIFKAYCNFFSKDCTAKKNLILFLSISIYALIKKELIKNFYYFFKEKNNHSLKIILNKTKDKIKSIKENKINTLLIILFPLEPKLLDGLLYLIQFLNDHIKENWIHPPDQEAILGNLNIVEYIQHRFFSENPQIEKNQIITLQENIERNIEKKALELNKSSQNTTLNQSVKNLKLWEKLDLKIENDISEKEKRVYDIGLISEEKTIDTFILANILLSVLGSQ